MNNINIFVEIKNNYLQLFDFTEVVSDYSLDIENLELIGQASLDFQNSENLLETRLIFWEHNFNQAEINYWFYLQMPKTKKGKELLWKKYFDISLTPFFVEGSFNFTDGIDEEKDLFYRKLIKNEELQLTVKKSRLLQRTSNLLDILKLT